MVTLLLTGIAAGAPGAAGALHLGAVPMASGTQYLGAGFVAGYLLPAGGGAPMLEGGTAVGDRFAVIGMFGGIAGEGQPLLGHVSGRWLAVDLPDARLAVTLSQTVVTPLEDRPLELHTTPGVAVDLGGERVRFDAAVPLWGVSSFGPAFGVERFPMPLLTTLGLDLLVGDEPGRHRVRFGWPELVSYHYRGRSLYLDVGGGTVLVAGAVFLKVGALL